MSKKGRSEPGFFGTINHYDEHGKKLAVVSRVYLVAIPTMTPRAERSVMPILVSLVPIITMTTKDVKLVALILVSLVVIITEMQKVNLLALAILECSAHTTIAITRAAMWPLVSMVLTTAPRYGRSVASGIMPWLRPSLVVPSFEPIML